jgi:hypothetical protein
VVGDTSSPYADRGTECHKACEDIDLTGLDPDVLEFKEPWQRQAVKDALRQRAEILPDNAELRTEVEVNLKAYGHADIFGTADVLAWDSDAHVLYVIDYKFGAGVKVSPENNPQLNIYALGALADYTGVELIKQVIIQPRIYDKALVNETTVPKLEAWFESVLDPAIQKAKEGKEFNPSDEACRWCPASPTECTAALDQLMDLLPKVEKAESIDVIAEVMERKSFIIQMLGRIEHQAIRMMQDEGIEIPGFKLVKKLGHTVWKDTKAADTFLRNLKLKEKERFTYKLVSPSKAKKLIADKGAMTTRRMNRLNALTHRPDRGVLLVPTSDPRDAIDIKPAVEQLPDTLEDIL